jgi:hypothetical protein
MTIIYGKIIERKNMSVGGSDRDDQNQANIINGQPHIYIKQ